MIIDFHTHAFPDTLAVNAVPALEKIGGIKAAGDGTIRSLVESMEKAGIDKSVVCPVATKKEQVRGINDWIMSVDDNRIIPFGSLFPDMADVDDEVKRLVDNGVKGVKLHPDYQKFFVDDESVFPIYEACVKHGLIILFHAGFDIGLPEPVHAPPDKLAAVVERFKGLTVIAAHMGGHLMWDQVENYLLGKELYLDTAYFLSDLTEQRFLSLMRSHGTEKVLFASDFPWLDQYEAVQALNAWSFTDEERRLVGGENAVKILNL